jgi:pimeloyl-ACP methyl ester carboxylesterase
LIFYPGGLVEPTAYAPILRGLAEEGVRVIITPMPLNLAILNSGVANSVIDESPDIDEWIIAGHSLGGASAAIFADKNSNRISGIAVWDSYPPSSADLSDNDLRAISIYGTTEGIPNTDDFNQRKYLMPEDTLFMAIEGANHAQFGDYGPQKGDVEATLSLAEQHDRVIEIMLNFIDQ